MAELTVEEAKKKLEDAQRQFEVAQELLAESRKELSVAYQKVVGYKNNVELTAALLGEMNENDRRAIIAPFISATNQASAPAPVSVSPPVVEQATQPVAQPKVEHAKESPSAAEDTLSVSDMMSDDDFSFGEDDFGEEEPAPPAPEAKSDTAVKADQEDAPSEADMMTDDDFSFGDDDFAEEEPAAETTGPPAEKKPAAAKKEAPEPAEETEDKSSDGRKKYRVVSSAPSARARVRRLSSASDKSKNVQKKEGKDDVRKKISGWIERRKSGS